MKFKIRKTKSAKSSYLITLMVITICLFLISFIRVDIGTMEFDMHMMTSYIPNYNEELKMIDGITYSYTDVYDAFEINTLDDVAVNKVIEEKLSPLAESVMSKLIIYLLALTVLIAILLLTIGMDYSYMVPFPFILLIVLAVNIKSIVPYYGALTTPIPYSYTVSPYIDEVTEESFTVNMEMFRQMQMPTIPNYAYIDIKGITDEFENNYYKLDGVDKDTQIITYVRSSNQEMVDNKVCTDDDHTGHNHD